MKHFYLNDKGASEKKFWDLSNQYTKVCNIGRDRLIMSKIQTDGTGLSLRSVLDIGGDHFLTVAARNYTNWGRGKIVCLEGGIGILEEKKFIKINQDLLPVTQMTFE